MEFPGVLVFGLGISKISNKDLQNFQGWSFALSGISRGKVKNEKFQGGFQKSIYILKPNPTPNTSFSKKKLNIMDFSSKNNRALFGFVE